MSYLLSFLAVTIVDFLWVRCVAAVSSDNALKAGMWAIPLYAVTMFATVSIVEDRWQIIPALFGSFVGTYVSVWYANRSEK